MESEGKSEIGDRTRVTRGRSPRFGSKVVIADRAPDIRRCSISSTVVAFENALHSITLAQTGQELDRAVIDAFVHAAENPVNLVKEPSQECSEVVVARASLDSPSGEVLGVRPMKEVTGRCEEIDNSKVLFLNRQRR